MTGFLAVVGATGTGKSALSLELATALREAGRPAEIVNADAMQFYRGMDIGTAKLPMEERRGIPHHLFDVLDVTEEASVAWYQPTARAVIDELTARGVTPILVGGSGLYVSSVIHDFRFPPRDRALRERLERELEEEGLPALIERLRLADPATADRIDAANARRVVRALEVHELAERGHGAALPERPVPWRPVEVIGVSTPREVLVERLDRRVETMWAAGLVAETAELLEHGLEQGVTAARAIGYAQAVAQLRSELTEAQAIAETQRLTRRYARRQVSWFKRYPAITWVDGGSAEASELARRVRP
ncbi:tRNA (adenosine(37)-N6)-dimethylallyltransferase MiaA [Plantibacter flavus]|uniref:tRNA (adenosine(37)-N6)-dimethylallyltransferase MiaA n=1 Tax=Plantibacter TaxID=190323 RepID=UPI00177E0E0F|nr:tRNA (adenosine(37)-N6)-dimethylallyltransferase MiaA [Plantibacter flavus]MBD8468136.1 tRNA (adenosine(37)-N6)-dimethylallyltransferase MiaA [Plantibacter sp. CFBP 8798]MDD9154480.1 tRNA (adenosine(37)-N6)-dimethylallyltransferase MiaA [Plantibacter flavus]